MTGDDGPGRDALRAQLCGRILFREPRAPLRARLARFRVGLEIERDPFVVADAPVHAAFAPAPHELAVLGESDHLLCGRRDRDLDHRHLDETTLAGSIAMFERGDDRERGVRADHRVDDTTGDDRRPALVAGDPRHPGELLHRLGEAGSVAPRSGEPERRKPQHHDVGPDRADLVVGEAEVVEHAGCEVLGDDVAAGDEPPRDLATRFL